VKAIERKHWVIVEPIHKRKAVILILWEALLDLGLGRLCSFDQFLNASLFAHQYFFEIVIKAKIFFKTELQGHFPEQFLVLCREVGFGIESDALKIFSI